MRQGKEENEADMSEGYHKDGKRDAFGYVNGQSWGVT